MDEQERERDMQKTELTNLTKEEMIKVGVQYEWVYAAPNGSGTRYEILLLVKSVRGKPVSVKTDIDYVWER